MAKKRKATEPKAKRQYTVAPVVKDPGIECPHCHAKYGHAKHNKYPNGRQRMVCGTCGRSFVKQREV